MPLLIKLFLIFLFVVFNLSVSAQKKNVLVLHSYHQGYVWTDSLNAGLQNVLESSQDSIELYFEYLDSKRNFSAEYWNSLYSLYKIKSRYEKYDVIIICDNDALNFILKYRAELYSDIPIVFCGVNLYNDSILVDQKNITGVIEANNFCSTVDMIMDLFPKTTDLYILNDNQTTTSKINLQLIKTTEYLYRGRIKFHYWDDKNMFDICIKNNVLNPKTDAIFISNYYVDKDGTFVPVQGMKNAFLKNKNIPIFSNHFLITKDIVIGGKIESGFMQGSYAAHLVLDVLKGIPADSIPIQKQGLGKYLFSYTRLREFGINENRLPENSTVINRPSKLFRINKNTFLSIISAFFILTVIIVVLYKIIRQKQKVEELLIKEKSDLKLTLDLQSVNSKVVALFNSTNDFNSVIADVLDELIRFYKFDRISLFRVVENDKIEIKKIVSRGPVPIVPLAYKDYFKFERLVRLGMKNGIHLIENSDELSEEEKNCFALLNISSMAVFVMQLGGNRLGQIFFIMSKPFTWTQKLIQELSVFAAILSNAWERNLQMKRRILAEKEILKANQMVEKAARISTIGIVASGLTHEINQPLNALRVTVDSIKYWQKSNPLAVCDFVLNKMETLSKGVARIDDIIKHMRNFWITPGFKTTKVRFLLNDAVRNACDLVENQIKEAGIAFVLDLPKEDIVVETNEIQLEQIVINLVVNSLQAFKKSEVHQRKLTVLVGYNKPEVSILVRDNALGIKKTMEHDLFDPFYSTKIDENGTGLGLALVKFFIDNMNGSVHYCNNDIGGLDFIIKFTIK